MKHVEILYEDKDIIVVVKPAGMPSQPERSTSMDMVSYLKNMIAARDKVRNPYISVVHRLDRPVGGVMVYGKNQKAAAALSAQIAQRTISKRYMAVVHGSMEEKSKTLIDFLIKNGRTNCSEAVTEQMDMPKEAKRAELYYEVISETEFQGETYSLLNIKLMTGRHHQIRVQMSHAGHPIAGDSKYGMRDGFFEMGLFSLELRFDHPVSKKQMNFTAKPCGKVFEMFADVLVNG